MKSYLGSMRKREILELLGVMLTSIVYLVFENVLSLKVIGILVIAPAWIVYIPYRIYRDEKVLSEWGFRTDNLRKASTIGLVLVLGLGSLIVIYRWWMGWIPLPRSAIILFLLYPLWGIIQQLFLQGLVIKNLESIGVLDLYLIPAGGILFGLVHLPDVKLALLSAGAGWIWTWMYLRVPNLYVLGVVHGWLGGLTYYWILERNPWEEMFPR